MQPATDSPPSSPHSEAAPSPVFRAAVSHLSNGTLRIGVIPPEPAMLHVDRAIDLAQGAIEAALVTEYDVASTEASRMTDSGAVETMAPVSVTALDAAVRYLTRRGVAIGYEGSGTCPEPDAEAATSLPETLPAPPLAESPTVDLPPASALPEAPEAVVALSLDELTYVVSRFATASAEASGAHARTVRELRAVQNDHARRVTAERIDAVAGVCDRVLARLLRRAA